MFFYVKEEISQSPYLPTSPLGQGLSSKKIMYKL